MFDPGDGVIKMLAGIYYSQTDRKDLALEKYKEGLQLMPDSAELNYNIGLLYSELGQWSKANEHAVKAYSLGSQLPGLKRRLIRNDAWNPDILESQVVTQEVVTDTDTERTGGDNL